MNTKETNRCWYTQAKFWRNLFEETVAQATRPTNMELKVG